jgi:malonate-semialdehyde dehydrogenase (acetylating)/methylmalonate-semialdehyde dehydrogenase
MTFVQLDTVTDLSFVEGLPDRGRLGNWIGGRTAAGEGVPYAPVTSPYTGATLGEVPLCGPAEVGAAVAAGAAAFDGWRGRNIRERAAVMFRFKRLLDDHLEELGRSISAENGKTLAEAKAEVIKGIEVVEFATSLPHLAPGRAAEVAAGVECYLSREPLGVVASITPFNFPAMVPLWTIPIALTLGNCVVHKPSEQVPITPLRLAELLAEAGLPPGVFAVVQGGRAAVEALCDHPQVRALSFVGSTAVARAVYHRAALADKRVLALGGAKNHLIVMPDAEPETTARAVLDAATGCAGQRCMAASVLVAVRGSETIVDTLVERARNLRLGIDMGAVISSAARDRIAVAVGEAAAAGADVVVDGRDPAVTAPFRGGYWLGPTLVDGVRPDMAAARDEIFGPVLSIVRVDSLADGLAVANASGYGNATSVFTASGDTARQVAKMASAGMIGINVGIPVPRDPFGFGGWNQSKFGVGDITGESSLALWTQDKKVTARWSQT